MTGLETKLRTILDEKLTKLVPENIKKDVTIFDVTGTLESGSGDVKLFETIEEMQADATAKEGDLAVVYRSEIQNATVDSHFQTATFPDTVILDTAITDYVDVRYRATDSSVMFNCWGNLDSSRFMMDCYSDSGEVRIEYTSSDGIIYTRTDTTGNPVDFGTEIYYERPEMWNDAIGKFIQIGGGTFEGLYESQSIKVKNTYILDNNRIKIAQYDNFNDSQYALMIKHKFSENEISEYTLLTMNKYIYPFIDSNNKLWVYNSNLTTSLEEYSVNAESYSSRSIIAKTSISNGATVNNITDIGITVDLDSCIPLGNPLYSGDSTDVVKTIDELTKIKDISTIEPEQVYELKYLPASTQFTLKDSNELLPGKIAYGKNGVVTGDGSIWKLYDYNTLMQNIPTDNLAFYASTSFPAIQYAPYKRNVRQSAKDFLQKYTGFETPNYGNDYYFIDIISSTKTGLYYTLIRTSGEDRHILIFDDNYNVLHDILLTGYSSSNMGKLTVNLDETQLILFDNYSKDVIWIDLSTYTVVQKYKIPITLFSYDSYAAPVWNEENKCWLFSAYARPASGQLYKMTISGTTAIDIGTMSTVEQTIAWTAGNYWYYIGLGQGKKVQVDTMQNTNITFDTFPDSTSHKIMGLNVNGFYVDNENVVAIISNSSYSKPEDSFNWYILQYNMLTGDRNNIELSELSNYNINSGRASANILTEYDDNCVIFTMPVVNKSNPYYYSNVMQVIFNLETKTYTVNTIVSLDKQISVMPGNSTPYSKTGEIARCSQANQEAVYMYRGKSITLGNETNNTYYIRPDYKNKGQSAGVMS